MVFGGVGCGGCGGGGLKFFLLTSASAWKGIRCLFGANGGRWPKWSEGTRSLLTSGAWGLYTGLGFSRSNLIGVDLTGPPLFPTEHEQNRQRDMVNLARDIQGSGSGPATTRASATFPLQETVVGVHDCPTQTQILLLCFGMESFWLGCEILTISLLLAHSIPVLASSFSMVLFKMILFFEDQRPGLGPCLCRAFACRPSRAPGAGPGGARGDPRRR